MNLLQDIYIVIFNTSFRYTERINENIRNWIVRICIFLLTSSYFVLMILTRQGITDIHTEECTKIGTIVLIILCFFSVRAPLERIKWNKWITVPYFVSATWMTLMSFDHFTGAHYQSYAIMMLLIFPAIYFIWGNRKDYMIYFDWFAKSLVILGTLTAAATIILAPLSGHLMGTRYIGLTDNPNVLGMINIVVIAAAVYLIYLKKRGYIFYSILTGIYISFTLLTVSRTAIGVVALQLIVWVLVTLRTYLKKQKAKTIIFLCLAMLIMFVSMQVTDRWLQRTNEAKAATNIVMTEQEELQIADSDVESRFSTKGKSLREFTSGRTEIWKWYIDRINIMGNDCTNHKVPIAPGVVYHNAHNTVLEIAYRFGAPAGIAYAVFMLSMVVNLIIGAMVRAKRKYTIFIVLLTIAYFLEAMLDVMTLPFERGPVLMFYMALIGVFEGDFLSKNKALNWNI